MKCGAAWNWVLGRVDGSMAGAGGTLRGGVELIDVQLIIAHAPFMID